jgi:hypothetical protein
MAKSESEDKKILAEIEKESEALAKLEAFRNNFDKLLQDLGISIYIALALPEHRDKAEKIIEANKRIEMKIQKIVSLEIRLLLSSSRMLEKLTRRLNWLTIVLVLAAILSFTISLSDLLIRIHL